MKKAKGKKAEPREVDVELGNVERVRSHEVSIEAERVHFGTENRTSDTETTSRGTVGGQQTDRTTADDTEELERHSQGTVPDPPAPLAGAQETHRPGAFAVRGVDASQFDERDAESASQDRDFDRSVMSPVSAQVVDVDEEDHRFEERVNRRLQEQRQTAPVAQVVRKSDVGGWFDNRRKRLVAIIGSFLLIAIVLAVVLGVMLPRIPEPSEREKLITLLSAASLDDGAALRTPGTPQNKASKWLLSDFGLRTYSDQRRLQRYALATLYFSTNGNNWTANDRWLDRGHECGRWRATYESDVLNCTESGGVRKLYLIENNLQGTVPDEIGMLSDSLEDIYLWENKLTGPFPKSIIQLTNLLYLNFAKNEMTGTIPTALAELSKLEVIYIYKNHFTGTIPAELSRLQSLGYLDLDGNKLTGTIPSEIATMTNLYDLDLWGNRLTGPIPSGIGALTLLDYVSLRDNALTGSIPNDIGRWTLVVDVYLQINRLTGTIPSSVNNMTSLERMHLYNNLLTGTFVCPSFITECFITCTDDNATCRVL